MNEQEQRIAIAREVDFYILQDGDAYSLRHGRETTIYPWHRTPEEAWDDSPEYLHDLNACRDMRRALTPQDGRKFGECLVEIVSRRISPILLYCKYPLSGDQVFSICDATEPEQCEAFLRTIGKWKETK